jgi:hypothetical protein
VFSQFVSRKRNLDKSRYLKNPDQGWEVAGSPGQNWALPQKYRWGQRHISVWEIGPQLRS